MAVIADSGLTTVTVNERTTVGSVWPVAAIFDGKNQFKATEVGLKIGSQHTKNLVKVSNGDFGDLVVNGDNLTFHETVSRMNVLSALMASCAKKIWKKFVASLYR